MKKELDAQKLSKHKREYIHEYMLRNYCKPKCEINTMEDLEKANGTI